MSQSLPPFSTLPSRANPQRVKRLLASDVYKPVRALFALAKRLEGHERDLLDVFWSVAITAALAEVAKANYTNGEVSAALAVTTGTVAPPL